MFEDLIGNKQAKETLSRLIASGRIPNALLFSGVDGVGKKAFAMEIAKTFVCRGPGELPACGTCHSCSRVASFTQPTSDKKDDYKQVFFTEHPDVGFVLPFNKNILVDAIRELEREAYFRPFEAPARVFIIEDADKMNDAASNALLKTLEEPASTSYIFLISSRPDSMLQTIHSRCQVIRFACLEAREIEAYLVKTGKISPVDAGLISRLCSGSIGRALSMDVEKFYSRREAMMQVLQSLVTKAGRSALLQTAESMNDPKNKDAYEGALETLQSLIRDLWILRIGRDREEIVNFDLAPRLEKLAGLARTDQLAGWIGEIELLRESLAVNINKKIATSALFTQMAA